MKSDSLFSTKPFQSASTPSRTSGALDKARCANCGKRGEYTFCSESCQNQFDAMTEKLQRGKKIRGSGHGPDNRVRVRRKKK